MKCNSCGAEIAPGTKFCPVCGGKIQEADEAVSSGPSTVEIPTPPAGQTPNPQTPPVGQTPNPQMPNQPQGQFNGANTQQYGQQFGGQQNTGFGAFTSAATSPMGAPAPIPENIGAGFATIIRGLRSPLYLAAICIYTASLVFTLVNTLMGYNSLTQSYYQILNSIGNMTGDYSALGDFYGYGMGYGIGAVIGGLIGMAPSVLIAVGLWMLFAEGRKSVTPIKNTGLTIIRVLTMITLVLTLILLAFCLILCFLLIVAGINMNSTYYYYYDNSGTALIVVGIILMIVIAVSAAVVTIYYLKLIGTIKGIDMQMTTGTPTNAISMLVIVITFIMGGLGILGSLGTLFNGGVVSGFSELCSGVATIIFGLILMNLKNENGPQMVGGYSQPTPVQFTQPNVNQQPNINQQQNNF